MTVARTTSAAVIGVTGHLVQIEACVTPGPPGLHLIGVPDSTIVQTRDRVRAAVINSGCRWPPTPANGSPPRTGPSASRRWVWRLPAALSRSQLTERRMKPRLLGLLGDRKVLPEFWPLRRDHARPGWLDGFSGRAVEGLHAGAVSDLILCGGVDEHDEVRKCSVDGGAVGRLGVWFGLAVHEMDGHVVLAGGESEGVGPVLTRVGLNVLDAAEAGPVPALEPVGLRGDRQVAGLAVGEFCRLGGGAGADDEPEGAIRSDVDRNEGARPDVPLDVVVLQEFGLLGVVVMDARERLGAPEAEHSRAGGHCDGRIFWEIVTAVHPGRLPRR